MKDPYLDSLPTPFYMQALGYPDDIRGLVYPDVYSSEPPMHTLSWYDRLWFHPGQADTDTNLRPTGHEVHRILIKERKLCKCFDFLILKYLSENADQIPSEWIALGVLALGWKSAAYNTDGDMCVPHLNCRGKVPVVRWRPLSFRMNGAEATPLTTF